ncbi:hypothetical protein CRG98_001849 [Punica granatum]|uniref:Uncharacterized protein n=1 Tax=Punica granatum TaxID=22663 RepID=A0A2I0LAL9_PUNGR|nr:hypothetical protein CRG98_001849 [Punica granatum]
MSRPDWAVFGSEITTVALDGILMQGRWLPTPKRPRMWLWWSFGSKVVGLIRTALQRSRKTEHDGNVRTRISSRRSMHARAYATRLRSVHLPGDARQTYVRRSRHLPFYDSKVEGRQDTRV